MRIGISFLSFGNDIFAGMENSLYNLGLGFLQLGASVHVYSGNLSGREAALGQLEVFRSALLPSRLPRGDETVKYHLARNMRKIREELADFCASRTLDLLYVCDPLWGVAQEVELWKKTSVPMILSLRVLNTADLLQAARRAPFALYTTTSSSLRGEILQQVPLSPLVVIPNSFDVTRFYSSTRPTTQPIIFCNARISQEKGVLDLVACLPLVLKSVPQAELWLCGGGFPFDGNRSYFASVKEAIRNEGISAHVRVLPKLEWDRIPEIIRASRLVVLPSLRETFGRAALEAMACGVPVVASHVGNLPDLLGPAGRFVPPSNPKSLADAIVDVLLNSDNYERMRAAGPELAKPYSNHLVAQSLLDAWSSTQP